MTSRPIPPHGTYARANGSTGYRPPCKCEPCTLAKRRANKRWKLNQARGYSAETDATSARQHLALLRQTRTWPSISKASGIAESNLLLINSGQRTTIHVSTRNAILAVKPLATPMPSMHVDATGSRRRLQALMAIGHSLCTLSRECKSAKDRLHAIAMGLKPTIRFDSAERIKAVYERLAYKPPAFDKYTARTRNLAASRGWDGPLAWDDDTINDPNAKPDKAKPYKAATKYVRDPDRKREIEHLYLLGESREQIARRLGGNEKYITDQLNAILRERAKRAEKQRAATHPTPERTAA